MDKNTHLASLLTDISGSDLCPVQVVGHTVEYRDVYVVVV